MVLTSSLPAGADVFCGSVFFPLADNGRGEVGEVGEVGRLLVRFYLRLKKCCVIVYCVLSVGIVGTKLVSDV